MTLTLILFLPILFLTVLPVSRVAVESGRSVTIPCLYDREYDYHVKYWCNGSNWNYCETVVCTDSPTVKGETSITDDPTHHVFTVTMTMLTTWDSGYYWCAVDIQRATDKGAYLYLSVTAGPPGLWVEQQEVAGVEGGHVSVPCHYNEPSSMKKWCRIEGSCVEVNSGESGKSGRSEMEDDRSKKVFTVTVRELNMEDTGWYWCATGELQIPVHLTVTQKTTTTTVTTLSRVAVESGRSVTIPCLYDREYDYHVKYWCNGSNWNYCETVVCTDSPKRTGKSSITDDPTYHVFTVTMRKLQMKDSGSYWCAVEIQGAGDKGAYLHMSVTAGPPGLWVEQQEVAGVEGGHVSVPCHYNEPSSMKKWCRIEGSCVEVNSGKSGRSEMKDDRSKKVFTVTVRELNMEDTGWYWCAVGELQIPVHLTITQKTTTTVTTHTINDQKTSPPEQGSQLCSGAQTCLRRTLWVLRHTGLVLVFLLCTAVAFWKIWQNRRVMQSRENRRHRTLHNQNNADVVSL
ncbi:polymeric immunoglobulin receptor-like [Conger conger]|uniref:polymeric immunoglobulin receptor-like n=1 Tax=Conger conger TaxID=82655 RepID=UPI002A5ACA5C|nr:polymeric immunoglobulin receptor-like [Conger conger]